MPDQVPIRIVFDPNSDRIDIVTGTKLPNYKAAVQESVEFFLGRLDSPDDFIYYFHDGLRQIKVDNLAWMRKDQPQFGIWNIAQKSGGWFHPIYGPRIHHDAVSFIPLSPSTGQPEKRVYVMLTDLNIIDWGGGPQTPEERLPYLYK